MKMHNPLSQFEVQTYIPIHIGPLDISLTNSSVAMLLCVALITLTMAFMTWKMKIIPNKRQCFAESFYLFIKNMVEETVGHSAVSIIPLIATIFLFILFGNLLGLFPYSFTFTSHLSIVGAIAILGLFVSMILGVFRRGFSWFRVFFPKGVPWVLAPIIVPIEIISFLSKPFSLTVRLVMNMMVGHIMLEVVAGFVFALGFLGIIPLLFTGVLILFEAFIAFLQAYIFSILSCIYLREAFEAEND